MRGAKRKRRGCKRKTWLEGAKNMWGGVNNERVCKE